MPARTRAVSQPGEAELARRSARGDGEAFAELYERYSDRTFNLCYRIIGSRDDAADATQEAFVSVLRQLPKLEQRELAFGSYVFTCARHACFDLMARRRRAEPHADVPESARPLGAGGGGDLDPGDPADDPERNVLLEDQQEQIRAANATLPARQREALALFELDRRSYDEIAEIMQMNRNSVAQLLSRARINLRNALRGGALASIVHTTPECERALPLICASDDGQLDEASRDAAWLADHLSSCTTCPLRAQAMQEAGASYRAWTPIVAAPWLFRDTMARAAEAVGTNWDDVIQRRCPRERSSSASPGGAARPGGVGTQPPGLAERPPDRAAEPARRWWRSRIKLAAAVVVAALLLSVGVSTGLKRGERSPTATTPAAQAPAAPVRPSSAVRGERARKPAKRNTGGAQTSPRLPASLAPQRRGSAGLDAAPALPTPAGASDAARAPAPPPQQSGRRRPQRQPATRRPPAAAPTPPPTTGRPPAAA
ncbi:MAG TPA: sigma-70 family RNA polymerase sigma factor, partial [Solirubrobacteraceae bacterium]|nr:sigma-70 family RNA polymerase sigma factor [Solirubrobacteraceae bacterium]